MSENFVIRALQFNLSTGSTSAQTPNNLRASVSIKNAGGLANVSLEARIWGLPRTLMNQYTTLGKFTWVGKIDNTIEVMAGDPLGGMSTAFRGIVNQAYATPDVPDVPMIIQAFEGTDSAMKAVPPTSLKGQQDFVSIMSGLASKMGLQFQNGGVSGIQMSNVYLAGTYLKQVQTAIDATKNSKTPVDFEINNSTLSIWPSGGTKPGAASFTVDRDHGLIGFPTYTSYGLIITTLYNPAIVRGSMINLTSNTFTNASGQWGVIEVNHELESQMPNGKWYTQLSLATPKNSGVINTSA